MRNNRTILLQSLFLFSLILVACSPKTEGGLPNTIEFKLNQLSDVCTFVIEGVPEGSIVSFEVPGNQLAPAEHADSKGKVEGGWVVKAGESCAAPSRIHLDILSPEYKTGFFDLNMEGNQGNGEYEYMSRGSQK